jgi:hypothetical protein
MPAKRYIVFLSDEERQTLEELTTKGKAAARKIQHFWLLLFMNHIAIARMIGVNRL